MTDKTDWRSRYRTLVFETEQQEQGYALAMDCLGDILLQLKIALGGQSPRCDQLLEQVRAELQAGKLDAVPDLLQETARQVRQLDEARAQNAEQLIERVAEWALLLQADSTVGEQELLGLRQKLSSETGNILHLPELMDRLLALQRQIEPTMVASSVEPDDLAQHQNVFSSRLVKRLLELIQLLNVPIQHRARTHELIKQLESGPSSVELEACLEEISWLAQACQGIVEKDIQQYLAGLDEQLEYLRGFMSKTEASDAQQYQRNQVLDQTVREDVRQISQAVEHSGDIEELKRTVSSRLSNLIEAVDGHRQAEERHVAELKRERRTLLMRLGEMENKTELFRKSAEEAHLKSQTDPLTGLANRYAYDVQLGNELERFERYGTLFSIAVADVDFFKRINDEYGHLAGDKALCLIGRLLRDSLRSVDFLARFGGEEFVVVMPSTSAEAARQAAEKIRVAVGQGPFNFRGKPVPITLSVGVAEVTADDTAESLFERADRSLYAAKNGGRNRVVLDSR